MSLFENLSKKEGMDMKKIMNTRLALGMACSMGLAFGLAGTLQAALTTEHDAIVLRDHTGVALPADSTTAYSVKKTCGACHDYDGIEKHAVHAQLGANQHSGFNPYNPDSPLKERNDATSIGKNWVQSSGHVGKW
jgi:hypothetical protein